MTYEKEFKKFKKKYIMPGLTYEQYLEICIADFRAIEKMYHMLKHSASILEVKK